MCWDQLPLVLNPAFLGDRVAPVGVRHVVQRGFVFPLSSNFSQGPRAAVCPEVLRNHASRVLTVTAPHLPN